jgi:hypothetical protein
MRQALAVSETSPSPGCRSSLSEASAGLILASRVHELPLRAGIEDRMTMAPLSARRLAEMIELSVRVVAIEMVVAAQAVDLRDTGQLGQGTRRAYRMIRELVPFTGAGETLPPRWYMAPVSRTEGRSSTTRARARTRPMSSSARIWRSAGMLRRRSRRAVRRETRRSGTPHDQRSRTAERLPLRRAAAGRTVTQGYLPDADAG